MGQIISLKADYSTSNIENADAISENIQSIVEQANQKLNTNKNDIQLTSLLADYTLPFADRFKLNTGVKVASIQNNSNNLFERKVQTEWIK